MTLAMDVDPPRAEVFLNSEHWERWERWARFSPDGKWVAYRSDELGSDEIFPISFPDKRGPARISRSGGDHPVWSADGTKLYLFPDVDARERLKHHFAMSTLAEIEKAVEKLSLRQKQELMRFLDGQLRAESIERIPRNLSPAERALDLERWAASHEPGPGLPDSAIGRDAIYD